MEDSSRWRRSLLFLAFLLPPLVVRIVTLVERMVVPGPDDLLGVLSDFAVALVLLALVLVAKNRVALVVALGLSLLHSFGLYCNYEHILALETSIDIFSLKFLGDSHFVKSTLHVSNYFLLIFVFAGPVVAILLARPVAKRRLWLIAVPVTAVLLLVFCSITRPRAFLQSWRQYNFVHQNILGMAKRSLALRREKNIASEQELTFLPVDNLEQERQSQVTSLFKRDLEGTPFVTLGQQNRNVLLLIMEGVSGAYIDAMAHDYNRGKKYRLPFVSSLVQRGIVYRNFVAHNRRTNRGTYSLLCGDFPNLALKAAKMNYYAYEQGAEKLCLPRILNQEGYNTVYLQSAPLTFMNKDLFMRKAGYQHSYGVEWFEKTYDENGWGPDDKTFYEQVPRKIDELMAQEKPWFLTLLNAGTHHPYSRDPNFQGKFKAGTFPGALEYLDDSLRSFFDYLQNSGALDNTLVIITADESHGVLLENQYGRRMGQSWVPLAMLTPEGDKRVVDEWYVQSDMGISILDYLGLTAQAGDFLGRSVFRTYQEPRYIMFGNVYKNIVGMFRPNYSSVICSSLLTDCYSYQHQEETVVPGHASELELEMQDIKMLQQFLAENERGDESVLREHYDLGYNGVVEVNKQGKRYIVLGYQYLKIPPGMDLHVSIEVAVEEGEVSLEQDLACEGGRLRYYSSGWHELSAGEVFTVEYDYHTLSRMKATEIRLFAKNTSGSQAKIRVTRAKLSLQSSTRTVSGLLREDVQVRAGESG